MQERRDPWRHDLRISRRACSRRDDEDEPGQRITICRNAPTGVKRGVGLGGGRIDHRTKQVVEWTIQKRTAMKTQAAVCVSTAVAFGFCASTFLAPPAKADTQCPYPGVGILNASVGGIAGGFCDFPTEINGAHWHCEGGGVGLGLAASGAGVGSTGTLGIAGVGQGVSGVSCNWRCPDNTDAPAPNPPGAWREYLAPMNTTNYCKDHMTPVGFWSAPTLPTEGIPPAGELAPQPGETPAPQPIPPPLPTEPVPAPAVPPTAPGEPNP